MGVWSGAVDRLSEAAQRERDRRAAVDEMEKVKHASRSTGLIVLKGIIAFLVLVIVGVYLLTMAAGTPKAKVETVIPIKTPGKSIEIPENKGDESDIEAVKSDIVSYRLLDMPPIENSLGTAVANLAGIDGSVYWYNIASNKYKNNNSICCVEAIVDIPPHEHKKSKHIVVLFFRNRDTKAVKLDSLVKKSQTAVFDLMYGVDK